MGIWVGIKSITWNERGGVNCEMWIDTGGLGENNDFRPVNNWVRWYTVKDVGQFGGSGDTTDPFTETNGPITQFRLDSVWRPIDKPENGQGCEIRYASIRQLDNIPSQVPIEQTFGVDDEIDEFIDPSVDNC